MNSRIALSVRGLKKFFPITKGLFKKTVGYIKAVDDVSFDITAGDTLGLVGESGCGKSTVGNCIVRLLDIDDGEIRFRDQPEGDMRAVTHLSQKELIRIRYRQYAQMVFQDPYSSLNPRMTVKSIVSEPIICNGLLRTKRQIEDRVVELLEQVGLQPEYMESFPHAFSGGQRQRICIARALSVNPKVLVCDEAVSALDVSVQAQILMLMKQLQEKHRIGYLFISHDFAVIRYLSKKVAVMYAGKIVEIGNTEDIFTRPCHPYTEALLSSVLEIDFTDKRKRIILQGEVANPANLPSGCYFHPRCKYAQEICGREIPDFVNMRENHYASCHFAGSLDLEGIKLGKEG